MSFRMKPPQFQQRTEFGRTISPQSGQGFSEGSFAIAAGLFDQRVTRRLNNWNE
jgi:hypothetical protein